MASLHSKHVLVGDTKSLLGIFHLTMSKLPTKLRDELKVAVMSWAGRTVTLEDFAGTLTEVTNFYVKDEIPEEPNLGDFNNRWAKIDRLFPAVEGIAFIVFFALLVINVFFQGPFAFYACVVFLAIEVIACFIKSMRVDASNWKVTQKWDEVRLRLFYMFATSIVLAFLAKGAFMNFTYLGAIGIVVMSLPLLLGYYNLLWSYRAYYSLSYDPRNSKRRTYDKEVGEKEWEIAQQLLELAEFLIKDTSGMKKSEALKTVAEFLKSVFWTEYSIYHLSKYQSSLPVEEDRARTA